MFDQEGGEVVVQNLLFCGVKFSVILVYNDVMVVGVLFMLLDYNIVVFDKVLLIGYDDVLLVKYCCFKLIMFCYFIEMMVIYVVKLVLDCVKGEFFEFGIMFKYIFIIVK